MRQWELTVQKAAAELQDSEEELQEATAQLLSRQARCAEPPENCSLSSQQLSRCLTYSHKSKEIPRQVTHIKWAVHVVYCICASAMSSAALEFHMHPCRHDLPSWQHLEACNIHDRSIFLFRT